MLFSGANGTNYFILVRCFGRCSLGLSVETPSFCFGFWVLFSGAVSTNSFHLFRSFGALFSVAIGINFLLLLRFILALFSGAISTNSCLLFRSFGAVPGGYKHKLFPSVPVLFGFWRCSLWQSAQIPSFWHSAWSTVLWRYRHKRFKVGEMHTSSLTDVD